jgi:WD40 repeat protein
MVKILDPNHPMVRESLQNIVTVNFAELVKNFPSVDFNAASQKLAVGTNDGKTIVYDLRAATKVHVLDTHSGAIHGVSFSPDGKLIATLSLQESQIVFWQPAAGLFDSIKGAFGGHQAKAGVSIAGINIGKVQPYRSFPIGQKSSNVNIQDTLDQVRFEWKGERTLNLYSVGGLNLCFTV